MANFQIAYDITSIYEGGYANNPNDKGGETYKGIARNIETNWSGWAIIDSIKSKVGTNPNSINEAAGTNSELQQLVSNVFKSSYWDSLNLSLLQDQRIANKIYDVGVNMGVGTVAKFFQRALNIAANDVLIVDGKIGNKTITSCNNLGVNDKLIVWKMINCLQGSRYIDIIEANQSQRQFFRSWYSRVF